MSTPASPVEVLADDHNRRLADLEWLVWFARKSKGTAEQVAARAIDQYPELREYVHGQAQDHTITKGGRFDGTAFLDGLSDDEVMYDYPVAASGEPMDPVLFVRWDTVRAALEPTHD